MTITGNLLAKVKLYADSKYPNNEVENRIAQQSYLDGFQAGSDQTTSEWVEYCRKLEKFGAVIRLSYVIGAFSFGLLVRGWM